MEYKIVHNDDSHAPIKKKKKKKGSDSWKKCHRKMDVCIATSVKSRAPTPSRVG